MFCQVRSRITHFEELVELMLILDFIDGEDDPPLLLNYPFKDRTYLSC
jgi:hypothetical protein